MSPIDTPDETNVPALITDSLNRQASIKNIFGEPIQTQGKTIIPVAQIISGMGAGAGRGKKKEEGAVEDATGEGSGAGAGLITFPKGVFEITAKRTKFIPAASPASPYLVGAALGLAMGWLFSKRSRKI